MWDWQKISPKKWMSIRNISTNIYNLYADEIVNMRNELVSAVKLARWEKWWWYELVKNICTKYTGEQVWLSINKLSVDYISIVENVRDFSWSSCSLINGKSDGSKTKSKHSFVTTNQKLNAAFYKQCYNLNKTDIFSASLRKLVRWPWLIWFFKDVLKSDKLPKLCRGTHTIALQKPKKDLSDPKMSLVYQE